FCFFFSSRRRHTRFSRDWSSDVCSSDLLLGGINQYFIIHIHGVKVSSSYIMPVFFFIHQNLVSSAYFLLVEIIGDLFLNFHQARSEERRVGKECCNGW